MMNMKRDALLIIDPSALLAVLLNEKDRSAMEKKTRGFRLAAPGCINWEIANALYGAFKRKRITGDETRILYKEFEAIPINIIEVDMYAALAIACTRHIPTYDSYYIQCVHQCKCPLLTLDKRMGEVTASMGVNLL